MQERDAFHVEARRRARWTRPKKPIDARSCVCFAAHVPKTGAKIPLLGQVEVAVLEYLWAHAEGSVSEVHAVVGRQRGITSNTVGSALERLFKKGLAQRDKVSHSYRYRPALDRESYRARCLVDAAGGLSSLRKGGLLAAFVDLVADSDSKALAELERLVRAKREGSDS